MTNLKKFALKLTAIAAISTTTASAAVSITWDFSPGNEHGWTTVSGVSWLDVNGVEAGQADGVGGNVSGNTIRAHDGAHTNFLYRSPTLNFGTVHATDPVLEIDWEGGAGNQDGAADPANAAAIVGGSSSAVGSKGLALLNLTTGNYDAVYYDGADGAPTPDTISLTLADLTGAGISLDDNYQLDFFDNDDGGWGWTRLQEVRLDSTVIGQSTGRIEIRDIDYIVKGQPKKMTRVSPIKPGLKGARNWATAQVRAASYSREGFWRLVLSVCITFLFIVFSIGGEDFLRLSFKDSSTAGKRIKLDNPYFKHSSTSISTLSKDKR